MKLRTFLTLSLAYFLAFQTISAQVREDPSNPLPDYVRRNAEKRDTANEINGIGKDGMIIEKKVEPLPPKKDGERVIFKESYERTKGMLEVPQRYYDEYRNLLAGKNVRIARLQPERNCLINLTVIVNVEELERCADVVPILGGGSLYSFRSVLNYPSATTFFRDADKSEVTEKLPLNSRNKEFVLWDIHFRDGNFDAANKTIQGIVADVGNVALENLNLKSAEIEFLNDYKSKRDQAEIKEQSEEFKKGVRFNNFTYSNTVSANLNSTYVLRLIDYRLKLDPKLKFNKNADLMIVFKVIGHENDGSVIIIWKELKTKRLKTKNQI